MQIGRIYSNKPDIFFPIDFNYGDNADVINIIIGEVRRPQDKKRDSHNLGKTTLLHLIDFLMLKGLSQEHFLSKHQELFADFVFYLEIALNSGDYATVRRGVSDPNLISLARHGEPNQDFTDTPNDGWAHSDLPIVEAVTLLDAWLDLRVLKPYDYRKAITYFLRSQQDWSDELQLQKFQLGRDLYWKPFVAHLFGFKGGAVQRKYELDDTIQKLKQKQADLQAEVQFKEDDLPELAAKLSYRWRMKASIAWNSCELRPPVEPCGGADTVGIIGETAAAIGECLIEGIEILEVGVGDRLVGQWPEMLGGLQFGGIRG